MEKIITALKLIAIQLERANELKEIEIENKFDLTPRLKDNLINKGFESKRNVMLKELKNGKTLS